jgi:oligopeptide transport system permease protein
VGQYTLRRLLQMIPVFLGTTFFIFAMVFALPGDPFAGKCGDRPCPDAYVAAQTEKYGLDQPLMVQYAKYMGNLLTGDFGETFSGEPVINELARAFPTSFKLTSMAILIEVIFGISAGVLSALRRGSFLDNLVLVSTLAVISIPVFVLGYFAQYFFGVQLGWFPPTVSSGAPISDLILPAFVLAALSLAFVARLMRTTMSENIRADYVRTAISKGLPRRDVVQHHIMRNSLIPVITFIGLDFGALMGGAVVTEGIFNIKGVGGLIFLAIRTREGATVTAAITVIVLIVLLVNLLVDLLYGVLDPRIRYE